MTLFIKKIEDGSRMAANMLEEEKTLKNIVIYDYIPSYGRNTNKHEHLTTTC